MRNYDEMSDFEINQLVASLVTDGDVIEAHEMATGPSKNSVQVIYRVGIHGEFYDYCNNPSDAWPIIVENRLSTQFPSNTQCCFVGYGDNLTSGRNPLRAAMICFLKMKDAES